MKEIRDIINEIRKDKNPYAMKVAKELREQSFGNRVLMDDAAMCLEDDCLYIKGIADRLEAALASLGAVKEASK